MLTLTPARGTEDRTRAVLGDGLADRARGQLAQEPPTFATGTLLAVPRFIVEVSRESNWS